MKRLLPEDHPSLHRHPPGFALVDLIIVVILLGIVATAGIPMLSTGLDASRLSGAAEETVTALEYARSMAISSGTQTRVTVDAAADTILVEQFSVTADLLGVEAQLSEADVETGAYTTMELPMSRGFDYQISFADNRRFTGVDITSAVLGAGNLVVFGALGTPSDGGSVTVDLNGSQMVVSVDDITGKVTVSE